MAEEESLDAESSTLSKNNGPIDHLKHLLKLGWDHQGPLIKNFVERHDLNQELREILNEL